MDPEARQAERQSIRDLRSHTGQYWERYVVAQATRFIKEANALGYKATNAPPYVTKP